MSQNRLGEAQKRAKQNKNKRAYECFFNGPYIKAECGKRAEKRNQRGCLTSDWKPVDLSHKNILVVGENGIGDEILTIECLADLSAYCHAVSWRCDPKLKCLFSRSFPAASFISDGDPQPSTIGTIYSWELIKRFRTKLDDFRWTKNETDCAAYLKPSAALKDTLLARYHDGPKKVLGLAWRSKRAGELLSDKACDIRDVAHWTHFFGALKDKVRFISLQYGNTADEIAFVRQKCGVDIYQDQSIDIYNDIDAAAAQIASMDYVVSISTTAAHLAGAMGVPGWVLLKKMPFPHWRAGKDMCPWYPTLRPIRQTNEGAWSAVLKKVADEFEKEVK